MLCASLLILEHCPKSLQDPLSTFYVVLQLLRGSLELLPVLAPHHPPLPFILCRSFSNHNLSNLSVLYMLSLPETFFTLLPRFQLLFPTRASKVLPYYPVHLGSQHSWHGGAIADCLSVSPQDRKTMCLPFSSCTLLSTNSHSRCSIKEGLDINT